MALICTCRTWKRAYLRPRTDESGDIIQMTADRICMIGVNEMSETRSIEVIVRLKLGGFSQSCQAEIREAGASIVLAMLATIQL
jgi:hypothetical protein